MQKNGVTDIATVTSSSPLEVMIFGDDASTGVSIVDGLTVVVDDVVGLVKYGSRWFVSDVLVP